MIQRLIEIQKTLNVSDSKFAQRIGISRALWYSMKHGKSLPGSKSIPAILKAFPELAQYIGER